MINLLYAMNEKYLPHVAASIASVLDRHGAGEVMVHIISLGLSHKAQRELQTFIAEQKGACRLYPFDDVKAQFAHGVDTLGFDISVLARLFVARLLPEDVERVLYLDGDTIVLQPLDELFARNMEGCPIAMVIEPTANQKRKAALGLAPADPYFNSGVILFDMVQWRKQECEKRVLAYFRAKGGKLMAPDQDALNGALKGQIDRLEPKYNFGTSFVRYSYRALCKMMAPAPYVKKQVFAFSCKHPAIVHYLGEERPWRAGNKHPYRREYQQYLAQTPWKGAGQEAHWRLYFFCFYLFHAILSPFPWLRWKIIDALIPGVMRIRAKKLQQRRG